MRLLFALTTLALLTPAAHVTDGKCQTRMLSPTPLHEEAACFDWVTSLVPPSKVKLEPLWTTERFANMEVLKQPYQFPPNTAHINVVGGQVEPTK